MKIEFFVDTGIESLLYPFRKYLKDVRYIKIVSRVVGFEQYEFDCSLLDSHKKLLVTPDNEEVNALAMLWDEECFFDFLHNIVGDIIFQNDPKKPGEVLYEFVQ